MHWLFISLGLLFLGGLWLFGERGKLLRRSTWAMVQVSGWKRFLSLATIHGYVYARWTKQYVYLGRRIAPFLGSWGKRWLANHYHSKVLPTELAQKLVSIQRHPPSGLGTDHPLSPGQRTGTPWSTRYRGL